ncbi:MAG: Hsp20/alpha crystallin family protein [Candidatus Electrothrix sp. AR5]|nr:Hsp20/alpha crystallin family protein [Candidatus Electrothrix sp. AR5]
MDEIRYLFYFLILFYSGGSAMNGRMQTKVLVFGIAALNLILPITPPSYAAGSINSPNVITQELKSEETGEKKNGENIPIQQNNKTEEDREKFTGPLRDFHREINRLFDQTFQDFGLPSFDFDRPFMHSTGNILRPVTDLAASDKEYTLTVEVPGAEKNDIKIEVADNVMTIRGEKKQKKKEEEKDYYRQERFYGSFQRVLSLPQDADQENITATFNQGVLTVIMPRKDMPKPNVKEIKIHSS